MICFTNRQKINRVDFGQMLVALVAAWVRLASLNIVLLLQTLFMPSVKWVNLIA